MTQPAPVVFLLDVDNTLLDNDRVVAALEPDYLVLGGGNVHKLKKLPPNCRAGENANAFRGGLRLWEKAKEAHSGEPTA